MENEELDLVDQIIDFNQQVLHLGQRNEGMMSDAEMEITKKCLIEEADEFYDAAVEGDYIAAVDGLCDSIYFAVGALYKQGLTGNQIRACMTAVHEANMEKKLGVNHRRGDGTAADAVKPEGWVPPEERIANILGDRWAS